MANRVLTWDDICEIATPPGDDPKRIISIASIRAIVISTSMGKVTEPEWYIARRKPMGKYWNLRGEYGMNLFRDLLAAEVVVSEE